MKPNHISIQTESDVPKLERAASRALIHPKFSPATNHLYINIHKPPKNPYTLEHPTTRAPRKRVYSSQEFGLLPIPKDVSLMCIYIYLIHICIYIYVTVNRRISFQQFVCIVHLKTSLSASLVSQKVYTRKVHTHAATSPINLSVAKKIVRVCVCIKRSRARDTRSRFARS